MVIESEALARPVSAELVTEAELRLGQIYHVFDIITVSLDEVRRSIKLYSDEALKQGRNYARSLGEATWQFECTYDAEILGRACAKRGRGNKDILEEGKMAAARAVAKEHGVGERIIRLNADIADTFFSPDVPENVERACHILREKEYYKIALTTDDPHTWLCAFAREKKADIKFNTSKARNMLEKSKAPGVDEVIEQLSLEDEITEAYYAWRRACENLALVVPHLSGFLSGYVSEIKYEMTRPTESIRDRILQHVRGGCQTIEDLAREMGYQRIHMAVFLNRLVDDNTLYTEEEERKPGARGAARKVYKIGPKPPEKPRFVPVEEWEEAELEDDGKG